MTDTASIKKDRKQRDRKKALLLCALILLALMMWMRQDNDEFKAGAAVSEANQNRRMEALSVLVEKASASTDPEEKIKIYDEIITISKDDKSDYALRCVSWAIYKKALTVTDKQEKNRLLEQVVEQFIDVNDKQVKKFVQMSLDNMINMADTGAEKIALCDAIMEKRGDRLPDSLAAWLLHKKAESTLDPSEQIAIYDEMLARFLPSADDSAFDLAVIAALDKANLIYDDKDELIRLYDIAIDAFLKTPQRTRYYLFDQAIIRKAELIGDPSLPISLYDQVIAGNVTEESVVQARSMRLRLLKDDQERLEACDEFISAHENSKNDFVQLMVARAMDRKAGLLTDPEAKAALWRSILEKSANIKDSRAKDLANDVVAKLATLSGDAASAIDFYDREAGESKSEVDALRALASKAGFIDDPAEKIRLYDEIIARGGASGDRLVAGEVRQALQFKVWLTNDKAEKIKLYDELIDRAGDNLDAREWSRVAGYMLSKARLLDDKDVQIGIYDQIIDRGLKSGNQRELESVAEAMLQKAEAVDDREEKIKLYDTVLFELKPLPDRLFFTLTLSEALRKRADLETEESEKLRLYDRYLTADESLLIPDIRMTLLLEKAGFMSDPAAKSRLHDEVIEFGLQTMSSADRDEISDFKYYKLINSLGQAFIGRADLAGTPEEKLKLYDQYLALPLRSHSDFLIGTRFEEILSKKAELSGDPSIKIVYFDDRIRAAVTDRERLNWYLRKRQAAAKKERPAINEEIIANFFDSVDRELEGDVAQVFLRKILDSSDLSEQNLLCDRLIDRYRYSADNKALSAVVQVISLKAKAATDDGVKLQLYSEAIDRYKDNDDYFVKKYVDELIAAKVRLEMKKK